MDSIFHEDDVYIYPELGDINPLNFDKVTQCVAEGKRVTLEAIDDIKKKIKGFEARSSERLG